MTATRRSVLRLAGLAAGLPGLTGCGSAGDPGRGTAATLAAEPDYGGWFDDVSNYRGTRDRRDESAVTVAVGAEGNGGTWAFAPPAVAVSPGTRVVWDWTGEGGPHNVVAGDGTYDSGRAVAAERTTFAHTFQSRGVSRYYCGPHRNIGMKGAVYVTE